MTTIARSGLLLLVSITMFGLTACGGGAGPASGGGGGGSFSPAPTTPAPLSANAYHADGLCAFEIPDGWKIKEMPGFKNRFAFGPASDKFAPNINVVDEVNPMSLKAYANSAQATVAKVMQNFAFEELKEISTTSGAQAFRISYGATQEGVDLHFVQTVFDGKDGRKIVVTFTRLKTQDPSLDALVDEKLTTFRLE